ncbi:hypothetical protein ILUMI_08842 [Ignelater luminosus]|uniref:Uncharacterized protein n=1 Tax=Ignelater luminosus TaxID=2038154 RepID=A0A8K0D669_IGNLU|nr:hypothetical protein ILUMI_08842 [Ignelater luminosus]
MEICFRSSENSIPFCSDQGNPQAILDKYDSTCGKRNVVIIFKYTGIRTENSKILLNGSFTVKEDITKDPKLLIRIERCKNKENLDTCEPFHNYRTNSYCTTANAFAGDFLKSFEPEWKCPLMKVIITFYGVYRATNAEMDATAFFMFPIESWYWKVFVNMLDRDSERILLCAIVEMHLKRV